jgi:hypothetical protein
VLQVLAFLTLLVSAADHWTTWRCLRAPVEGWVVTEANPISDWLFAQLGLVPGLLLDSALTLLAIAFLITTPLLPRPVKSTFFGVIIAWTGYAVVNNYQAIQTMGISLL